MKAYPPTHFEVVGIRCCIVVDDGREKRARESNVGCFSAITEYARQTIPFSYAPLPKFLQGRAIPHVRLGPLLQRVWPQLSHSRTDLKQSIATPALHTNLPTMKLTKAIPRYILQTAALLFLASRAEASSVVSSCGQTTNFRIYASTTGTYGQLGQPYEAVGFPIDFSGDKDTDNTYFSINTYGTLTIRGSAQRQNAGLVAYYDHEKRNTAGPILFANHRSLRHTPSNRVFCRIFPADNGDGTCDLKCGTKYQSDVGSDKTVTSLDTDNNNQWNLNDEYQVAQIKVDYS